MNTKRLVVALLLLAMGANTATAADTHEHKSKNARKVLAALSSVGLDNSQIKAFIENIDANTHDGYYTLAERRVPGGKVTLHYELGNGVNSKQVELQFAPDNSNWRAIARPDRVMK